LKIERLVSILESFFADVIATIQPLIESTRSVVRVPGGMCHAFVKFL
jgi:hypothetical protein